MNLQDVVRATIAPEVERAKNLDMDRLEEAALQIFASAVDAEYLGTGPDLGKFAHWIETTFYSACARGGALGKDAWEALQDPTTLEQLDRFAMLVTFLASRVTGIETTSLAGITVMVTFFLRSRQSGGGPP